MPPHRSPASSPPTLSYPYTNKPLPLDLLEQCTPCPKIRGSTVSPYFQRRPKRNDEADNCSFSSPSSNISKEPIKYLESPLNINSSPSGFSNNLSFEDVDKAYTDGFEDALNMLFDTRFHNFVEVQLMIENLLDMWKPILAQGMFFSCLLSSAVHSYHSRNCRKRPLESLRCLYPIEQNVW